MSHPSQHPERDAGPAASDTAEGRLRRFQAEITDLRAALDEHAIVAITDPAGRITYANEKFCRISGYSQAELLGQDHRLINSGHHPREFFAHLWRTISKGEVWHGDIMNRAKSGEHYWVRTTIVPFLDEQGKPRQHISIRADITELKRTQEKLERQAAQLARSNLDLEEFASIASHDLREPARGVHGCLMLLRDRVAASLDPTSREYLEHALDGADWMQHLIDSLLEYARVGHGALREQAVPLAEVVQRVLQLHGSAIRESGARVTHDPLPVVVGDPMQLMQLFGNLIANALKFRSPAPPEIHLGVAPASAETVRLLPPGSRAWEISVRDNGIGIAPEDQERVFGIFQRLHTRREFPGTGIGLAVCQRIAERHGGSIRVQSTPGQGSTFLVTLPGLGGGRDPLSVPVPVPRLHVPDPLPSAGVVQAAEVRDTG